MISDLFWYWKYTIYEINKFSVNNAELFRKNALVSENYLLDTNFNFFVKKKILWARIFDCHLSYLGMSKKAKRLSAAARATVLATA